MFCLRYWPDTGRLTIPGSSGKDAAGDEEILTFIRTKQPLEGGRIGSASDLDAAVVYFLSPGSAYTTGQVLAVDGGWTVSEGQLP
jgi:NAD(P)-dependent dehydrogenase (short-subunit alcohol dehydrogenase family)